MGKYVYSDFALGRWGNMYIQTLQKKDREIFIYSEDGIILKFHPLMLDTIIRLFEDKMLKYE